MAAERNAQEAQLERETLLVAFDTSCARSLYNGDLALHIRTLIANYPLPESKSGARCANGDAPKEQPVTGRKKPRQNSNKQLSPTQSTAPVIPALPEETDPNSIFARGRSSRGQSPTAAKDIKSRHKRGSMNTQPSPASELPPKVATPKVTTPKASTPGTKGKEISAKKAAKVAKVAKEEDMVVPPINVLIVEDNPINQNILSMFLRKKKIKHQTAKDGEEAVRKWRTGGFHLILMDIQLPVKDGIEATREIRELERTFNIGVFPMTPAAETPPRNYPILAPPPPPTAAAAGPIPAINHLKSSVIIVALTASSLQTDRVNALAAGCNDFLTKPVSLKWLEKKIIEWGCMQALIDFDGWRRWKSADPRDQLDETRKGFQTGPLAAAKSLAGRLKINPERRSQRQSSTSSTASTIISDPPTTAATTSQTPLPPDTDPDSHAGTSTPKSATSELSSAEEARKAEQAAAAAGLAEARKDLRDMAPNVATPLLLDSNGHGEGEGVSGQPTLAEVSAGMSELRIEGGGVSEEPGLEGIKEVNGTERVGEKPLPDIPPQ